MLLIFVELMLVTALALFFSTFSSPMLSAALTFGLYVVGHFSADLRNFQQVVDSPAAAAFARGLYWVLPNLAQFDVKSDVVHGVRVPLGYMAMTGAYAALYIAMLLAIAVAGVFAAGLQVDVTSRSPAAVVATVALAGVLLAAAVQVQAARERALPAADDDRGLAVPALGTALRAADRRLQRAVRRRLLDPRDSVLRRHQAAARRVGRRQPPVAAPPPSLAADAYPLLYPLLDITTTLDPRFNIAYRFGAVFLGRTVSARRRTVPIWRSRCWRRDCASSPTSGSTCRTSASSTTGTATTSARRPTGSRRRPTCPGAPWWLRSLAATTLAQGGDRQSSRAMWKAIREIGGDRLAAQGRRAPPAAAAGARR